MPYNIRIVSTYPPRRCGIGTFSRDLATALEHFTAEIGNIRIAAIDNNNGRYDIPVDLVIDQYTPQSWLDTRAHIANRARESANPTVVVLQHEYGLDPDENGNDGEGTNFIEMTKYFHEHGLTTLIYLHTVLSEPDQYKIKTVQELACYGEGLIVTTESAIDILESEIYKIDHSKLKHIDHGIRMQHPSQYDRLNIKHECGLENHFLITTLGLLSPDKGIQYGIKAFGSFLQQSCTDSQRKNIVYLIAGQFHPEFVKADGGQPYRQYQSMINHALDEYNLRWCKVHSFQEVDFDKYNVVFLDIFLDEPTLLKLYGATNVLKR